MLANLQIFYQMDKQIFDKLTIDGKHLDAADLKPNEKSRLYNLMKTYGASIYFSYDRFFKEGFSQWELIGVNRIAREFCEANDLPPTEAGQLFRSLKDGDGKKEALYVRMEQLGMSRVTTRKHFLADDFKPWERVGISHIIDMFTNSH